jgi:hypothetical protein
LEHCYRASLLSCITVILLLSCLTCAAVYTRPFRPPGDPSRTWPLPPSPWPTLFVEGVDEGSWEAMAAAGGDKVAFLMQRIVMHRIVMHRIVMHRIIVHRIVMHRIVMRRIVMHRIVLYRIVMHRIVIHRIVIYHLVIHSIVFNPEG